VGPKPVEDLGKIIARPPFGDLVTDDMIDMDSFGADHRSQAYRDTAQGVRRGLQRVTTLLSWANMSSTVTCQSGNASSNSAMSVFIAARLLTGSNPAAKFMKSLANI
jgi:hypothetical protein